jgi:hypothetical protein
MVKTRKQSKSSMTIPQLRKAFDHIESYTEGLLRREKDAKKRRQAFKEEWMRVFHRSIDDKAADAYIQFESKKSKKAKTRRMKGGSALEGAPLDYSTRPGIYGVYGSFPQYIGAGFSFGNDINKMAIQEGCNSAAEAAKFQLPEKGFGGVSLAQKGGKRSGATAKRSKSRRAKKSRGTRKMKGGAPTLSEFASALSFRPLMSSTPPTMSYSSMMEYKGALPYPPSTANTANPPFQPYKPSVITPGMGAITRDLGTEL